MTSISPKRKIKNIRMKMIKGFIVTIALIILITIILSQKSSTVTESDILIDRYTEIYQMADDEHIKVTVMLDGQYLKSTNNLRYYIPSQEDVNVSEMANTKIEKVEHPNTLELVLNSKDNEQASDMMMGDFIYEFEYLLPIKRNGSEQIEVQLLNYHIMRNAKDLNLSSKDFEIKAMSNKNKRLSESINLEGVNVLTLDTSYLSSNISTTLILSEVGKGSTQPHIFNFMQSLSGGLTEQNLNKLYVDLKNKTERKMSDRQTQIILLSLVLLYIVHLKVFYTLLKDKKYVQIDGILDEKRHYIVRDVIAIILMLRAKGYIRFENIQLYGNEVNLNETDNIQNIYFDTEQPGQSVSFNIVPNEDLTREVINQDTTIGIYEKCCCNYIIDLCDDNEVDAISSDIVFSKENIVSCCGSLEDIKNAAYNWKDRTITVRFFRIAFTTTFGLLNIWSLVSLILITSDILSVRLIPSKVSGRMIISTLLLIMIVLSIFEPKSTILAATAIWYFTIPRIKTTREILESYNGYGIKSEIIQAFIEDDSERIEDEILSTSNSQSYFYQELFYYDGGDRVV